MPESTAPQSESSGGLGRRHLLAAAPFIALALWFVYLWFVSGVIPYVEKYPNGQPKVAGYVERRGLTEYRRTGKWVTYHPNGVESGKGMYKNDQKVESTWTYFDESGHPIDPVPASR